MIFGIILGLTIISSILSIIILFGDSPSFRNTWIQKIRRGILISSTKLFKGYEKIDQKFNGRLLYYLNWLIPIGYLLVITFSFHFFFKYTKPMLDIGVFQFLLICFTIGSVYASTILSMMVSPGEVNHENLKNYHYKADNIIFFNNQECRTCHIKKPARSKHCSFCNTCYLLFDHHCIWINNCVGYYNYKYFLLFLVSNIVMLIYGGYLCFTALIQQTSFMNFWSLITTTTEANKVTGTLMLLCIIFSNLATGFTLLNLRYVYLGATTNEVGKWENIQHLVDLHLLYRIEPPIGDECYVEQFLLNGDYIYISLKNEDVLIDKRNLNGFEVKAVNSVENDLINIYDNGFWQNLKERICINK